jgi:hypothetical protein
MAMEAYRAKSRGLRCTAPPPPPPPPRETAVAGGGGGARMAEAGSELAAEDTGTLKTVAGSEASVERWPEARGGVARDPGRSAGLAEGWAEEVAAAAAEGLNESAASVGAEPGAEGSCGREQ